LFAAQQLFRPLHSAPANECLPRLKPKPDLVKQKASSIHIQVDFFQTVFIIGVEMSLKSSISKSPYKATSRFSHYLYKQYLYQPSIKIPT